MTATPNPKPWQREYLEALLNPGSAQVPPRPPAPAIRREAPRVKEILGEATLRALAQATR